MSTQKPWTTVLYVAGSLLLRVTSTKGHDVMTEDDAKAMVELVLDAARGGLAVAAEAYAKECAEVKRLTAILKEHDIDPKTGKLPSGVQIMDMREGFNVEQYYED